MYLKSTSRPLLSFIAPTDDETEDLETEVGLPLTEDVTDHATNTDGQDEGETEGMIQAHLMMTKTDQNLPWKLPLRGYKTLVFLVQ